VVIRRLERPPLTGTLYSSPKPGEGNCWLRWSSRRLLEKITALPSGVKSVGTSLALWKVRRVAAPPVDGMMNTSLLPWRSLLKAIQRPSRDHTGSLSYASWMEIGRAHV